MLTLSVLYMIYSFKLYQLFDCKYYIVIQAPTKFIQSYMSLLEIVKKKKKILIKNHELFPGRNGVKVWKTHNPKIKQMDRVENRGGRGN